MRINHNIAALAGQNAIAQSSAALNKSLEKLSTGLRINRASDDAAGLAVSEQMRTQIRGLGQAQRNAENGIALLQIAEGAANEMSNIMQRMRELSVQSANDTLTSVERGYNNSEFQQLMNEVSRIGSATQYNGVTLLDGSGFGAGAGSVLHIGANNNNGVAAGTVDKMTVTIGNASLASLGLVLTTAAANGTNVTSQANAFASITTIDTAIKSVSSLRATLGSYVNRLESAINNMANQELNTQNAESMIRDVDFASETTSFTRSQILNQASMAMLAQANAAPASIMTLLR